MIDKLCELGYDVSTSVSGGIINVRVNKSHRTLIIHWELDGTLKISDYNGSFIFNSDDSLKIPRRKRLHDDIDYIHEIAYILVSRLEEE